MPVNNSLVTADKCLPIIDEIFKLASKTAVLDAQNVVSFDGVKTVKVLKISSSGLGDYNRKTGYPKGTVTAQWEEITPEIERGIQLKIDRMDNAELLNTAFGSAVGMYMREQVAPEVDAYRFAKYASADGILKGTPTTFTTGQASLIMSAVDDAMAQMDAAEVPREGRVIFMNSNLSPVLNVAVDRSWTSEHGIARELSSYNGVPIVYVPPSRFNTEIELNPGLTTWGFNVTGTSINFMVIYKPSVLQITRHELPKIFTADQNQDADWNIFDYRLYHDVHVFDNKAKGIYLSAQAAVAP